MGAYQVEIYASDGQKMLWDSVSMELPGHSSLEVTCCGVPITFTGMCAGLAFIHAFLRDQLRSNRNIGRRVACYHAALH
jgi:hypothetical protein